MAPSRLLFGVPSRSISLRVDRPLIVEFHSRDSGRDDAHHVLDGLEDAQSAVPRVTRIAELDRFVAAGAGPRGNDRGPFAPLTKRIDFHGGTSAESSTWRAFSEIKAGMRSPFRLPRQAVRVKHPMSAARCEGIPGQTLVPLPGPAGRGIPPGSCRRRGPNSKPPCAAWRARVNDRAGTGRSHADPDRCSGILSRGPNTWMRGCDRSPPHGFS